jgi:DNA-binding transcriptional MerR regulator
MKSGFRPSEVSDAGYRYYDGDNLALLQQILFYRELEFSLKEIRALLSEPDHDRKRVLSRHRELLVLKQKHIAGLIRLVDETLGGDEKMSRILSNPSDYEAAKKRYAAEARERWGHTTPLGRVPKRNARGRPTESAGMMPRGRRDILGVCRGRQTDPSAPAVQELVKRWQALITKYHYDCTDDILAGLGEMYTADGRFTESIDRHGPGTARFISEAIRIYCAR